MYQHIQVSASRNLDNSLLCGIQDFFTLLGRVDFIRLSRVFSKVNEAGSCVRSNHRTLIIQAVFFLASMGRFSIRLREKR